MNGTKRLQWIESLRIISMFMVIVLHICLKSGVLYKKNIHSAEYFTAWLIESFCYCAVNCYALITGYVMEGKMLSGSDRFRFSKILPLWLQVFYYSAIITVLIKIFMPYVNASLIAGFTPLLSNQYWYFSAYFGMFFFIPFMNILIDKITKKEYILLMSLLFAVFSFIPFMSLDIETKDLFGTSNGYSTIWLMILYFDGAFIKKYGNEIKIKKTVWAVLYLICSIIPTLCSVLVDFQSKNIHGEFLRDTDYGGTTLSYVSPFTVIAAISLFMLLKDTEIKNRAASAAINFLAPASFSIYLIHTQPLVFNKILVPMLSFLTDMNGILMILTIIALAIVMFFAMAAVDYIRIFIFRLLKISERSEKLFDMTANKLKSMRWK